MELISAEIPITGPAHGDRQLPPTVRGYLGRALSGAERVPARVEITQTGTMWSKPGARPMHFTATERFAVERTAFCWEAQFRFAPGVALRVRDCYDTGEGGLTVHAFGLPLRRRSGPDVSVAEAYRYLAELPWVPHAMAANRELEWRNADHRRAEVSCHAKLDRLAVTFEFDASGDVVRCSTPARPRDVNGRSIPTPWGGEFSDYRMLGGVRLPILGEVYWDLPEGRFVYWRGAVTGVRTLDERFAGTKGTAG